MPKIGQAGKPQRPYVTVCKVCGCLVEQAVVRFNPDGRPGLKAWMCQTWQHRCGTEDREGCDPRRVYTDTPDGAAEAAELKQQQVQRAQDPWTAADEAYKDEAVALMREGGYCFEGDCGVCGACRLRAAGY